MAISIWTPVLYTLVVLGSLIVFSKVYRQRKVNKLLHFKPFYENNVPRDIYFELKSRDEKVPEKIMVASLLRWASEDLKQFFRMKETTPVIGSLHQKGQIGDDLFSRFTTSNRLIGEDLQEVHKEAAALKPGLEKSIMQLATEIAQNDGLRRRIV